MKLLYTIFLLITLFMSLNTIGQTKRKLINEANTNFNRFAYIDAREIYIKVANKGYASADLYQKIADSYYYNAEFEEAYVWYDKLVKRYEDVIDSEYFYRYAQCLKSLEKYKKANKVMEKFAALTGVKDSRAAIFKSRRYYLKLIEDRSGKFKFDTFKFNSEFSEHSPSFMPNGGLMFSSSRGGGEVSTWDKMPFLDLYSLTRQDLMGNNSNVVKSIKGTVNTPVHESSSTITKDGLTMYFTRNNFLKNELKESGSGTVMLKLYKAEYVNKKWTNIKELPFNSDNYSTAHPTLSPDDKKLYFASDMPGSYGYSDLYVVDIYKNNTYGKPRNLGYNINTEGKETFPFVCSNGDLYFASDGHNGLGGLDIFLAKGGPHSFAQPFNIGKPINGPYDDFSFIIDKSNDTGFFASNRPSSIGSDDIYSFLQIVPFKKDCTLYVKGKVFNKDTKETVPQALVRLFDKNMTLVNEVYTDQNGFYAFSTDCNVKYTIKVYKKGHRSQAVTLTTPYKNEISIVQNLKMSTNKDFKSRLIRVGDDLGQILELNTIYFDYDNSEIRGDAELELQKIIALLQINKHINIEIRSHTDSRADDNYNYQLSKERARATREYLVENGGIDRNRIFYKGYGETQLVNKCANGVDCSPEEHEQNRRCEFIILNAGIKNTANSLND